MKNNIKALIALILTLISISSFSLAFVVSIPSEEMIGNPYYYVPANSFFIASSSNGNFSEIIFSSDTGIGAIIYGVPSVIRDLGVSRFIGSSVAIQEPLVCHNIPIFQVIGNQTGTLEVLLNSLPMIFAHHANNFGNGTYVANPDSNIVIIGSENGVASAILSSFSKYHPSYSILNRNDILSFSYTNVASYGLTRMDGNMTVSQFELRAFFSSSVNTLAIFLAISEFLPHGAIILPSYNNSLLLKFNHQTPFYMLILTDIYAIADGVES